VHAQDDDVSAIGTRLLGVLLDAGGSGDWLQGLGEPEGLTGHVGGGLAGVRSS